MAGGQDILALDIATRTGFARGRVGEQPVFGSYRFAHESTNQNRIFADALWWLDERLRPQPRPDVLVIEALLPAEAKQGKTNRIVRDRLAGLHGIVRALAQIRGIREIIDANVADVRAHFIGERTLKRDKAKRAVIERCHRLGWHCQDDNAGDALACWSYACAIADPASALRVVPLFNPRLLYG